MKMYKSLMMAAVVSLAFTVCLPVQAQPKTAAPNAGSCSTVPPVYTVDQVHVVGVDPESQAAKDLLDNYNDLVRASNKHNIEDILKHYNPQFISGDNLNLQQIKSLIQETWKSYPDICYDSKPVEIRVNGDWATIETMDHSTATAPPDKDIMDVPGKLSSYSRSLLFFRKLGTAWEISSDSTIWEEAIIRYGIGDDVKITLSAPEQVKAGELYSATVQASIPEGTFTIATIDNQTLTYPHQKADDKFRPLGSEANDLQRVLKANTSNHNEIVTATLGLTALEQKNPDRPSLSLNGIATIVKRVNVVPISAEDVLAEIKKKELVQTSADGKIDLNNKTPSVGNNQEGPDMKESSPAPQSNDNEMPKDMPHED